MEKLQLDEELRFDQVPAHFADKRRGGRRGPTRGEEIVDQYDLFAALDRIDMQFHLGLAVFERVLGAFRFVRQSAFLPQRDKTNPEIVGHRGSEKKSTRVDPHDLADLLAAALFEERSDREPEQFSARENGRDVLEDDSFLGKIRDVANSGAQLLD